MGNNIEKHLRQTIKTLQEENKQLKQDLADELRAENLRFKAAIMALIDGKMTWSIEVQETNKEKKEK